MPSGTPCRPGHHAVWDTMPSGTPCRVGHHAVRDTMPSGIPCRLGYHAVWDAHRSERFESVADGIAAGWHTLCWRPAASSAFCSSALVCRGFIACAQRGTRAARHARSAARAPPAALDVARPRRGLPHSAPGRPLLCRVSAAPGLLALGSSGAASASAYPSPRQFGNRFSHGAHEPALGGTPC